MILSLAFAFGIFVLLWPYFVVLHVMDFNKNPETKEPQLQGRPARRTVGRINSDVAKTIYAVYGFYIVLCGAFYGTPELRGTIPDTALLFIITGLSAFGFYFVEKANRRAYAYLTMGQIVVIHLCCSVSSFAAFNYFVHGNEIQIETSLALVGLAVGMMLIFSRKLGER